MLTQLRISGLALLDDVELELGPGLNVLTGETGAGKSLLVDAVALVRGARASAEMIRAGCDEARIEALFVPQPAEEPALRARLEAAGIEWSDDGLLVRRVVGRSGRGRIHVNGSLSTAGTLAEIVGGLIDLAGQHEHQRLSDPSQHLAILDAYLARERREDARLVDEMAMAAERLRTAGAALESASLDERARAQKEDFLRFQLQELDEARLEAGEEERLKQERERLRGAEKLEGAARRGEHALYGREGAIVDELGTLSRELGDVGRIDPKLAQLGGEVEQARAILEEAARELRRYAEGLRADPERLAQVDERLHLLGRILKKHGGSVEAALARQAELRAELDGLEAHEERRAAALAAVEAARAEAERCAAALTKARRAAAKVLSERASAALGELGMGGAKLSVVVGERAAREGDDAALVADGKRISETGWDRVEFLLAANLGEEARPLARVASGGELSRLMLALKRVLAPADTMSTYVFDEVDTGIGGQIADVVGRLLKSVSDEKQVLCVTHLPQIAAYGEVHFHVEKRTAQGRTATVVRRLGKPDRVEELARMVGGAKVTAKARAHAEDLIARARL